LINGACQKVPNMLDFGGLLTSHLFSDFRFSLNKQPFLLHRGIIIQRSRLFGSLFARDPTCHVSSFEVPDYLSETFPTLLAWLYCSHSFRLEKPTICHLTKLALIFDVPTLLDVLISWLDSNVDHTNVLSFYANLLPMRSDLPSRLFTRMESTIEDSFEQLDPQSLALSLPFDLFVALVGREDLRASRYFRSAAIVQFISVNYGLSESQRSTLIGLYLKSGWIVSLPKLLCLVDGAHQRELTRLAARRLSNWVDSDLLALPQEILTAILQSDEIDAADEADLVRRLQALTSSTAHVNKHRNRAIWMCTGTTPQIPGGLPPRTVR
jgi:hypothetical protein